MRLHKIRINPLLVLLGLLPLLGWAVSFEQSVNRRRAEILDARAAYVSALTATRTQLAGLIGKVVADKTMTQNLSWKLSHSVQSSLEAKLEKGGLDQLALFVKNCQEIGRASVDKYVGLPCPLASGGPAVEQFFWQAEGDHPVLALSRKVAAIDGSDLVVLGMVHLDANWLNIHPELKQKIEARKLRIGGGGGGGNVLFKEGIDANGQAQASLLSDHSLDRFLLAEGGKDLAYGSPLLWPCLILAFACAAAGLLGERWRAAKSKEILANFHEWCRALTPGGEFNLPGKARPEATGHLADDLGMTKLMVSQAMQLKSDAIHGLTSRRHMLEGQLKGKEEEIQKLRHRLAELAELDSLAIQLARTTGSFLDRMRDFHDKAEDLSDIVGTAVAGNAHTLFNVLMDWQQGVTERGARKFLRSLSETPGAHEGDTLLDEQLILLLNLAGELADQATSSASRTHRLVETASFAARIAGLWHGLAMKTNADKSCASLTQPLEEAQGLVRLEKAFAGVDFANLITDKEAECIPELPKTVWVSSLYHLYLAMAELSLGQNAKIVTRMRRDQGKVLFVIQATTESDKPLPKRGEKQAYHMEISRSILLPFDVSLSVLPALDGPFPVALTWSEEVVQVGGGNDARLLPPGKEAAPQSLSLM